MASRSMTIAEMLEMRVCTMRDGPSSPALVAAGFILESDVSGTRSPESKAVYRMSGGEGSGGRGGGGGGGDGSGGTGAGGCTMAANS